MMMMLIVVEGGIRMIVTIMTARMVTRSAWLYTMITPWLYDDHMMITQWLLLTMVIHDDHSNKDRRSNGIKTKTASPLWSRGAGVT